MSTACLPAKFAARWWHELTSSTCDTSCTIDCMTVALAGSQPPGCRARFHSLQYFHSGSKVCDAPQVREEAVAAGGAFCQVFNPTEESRLRGILHRVPGDKPCAPTIFYAFRLRGIR